MVLSTNMGSFPSNSHVSATLSILLRFGEFWNPTNCEIFNADAGRTTKFAHGKSLRFFELFLDLSPFEFRYTVFFPLGCGVDS